MYYSPGCHVRYRPRGTYLLSLDIPQVIGRMPKYQHYLCVSGLRTSNSSIHTILVATVPYYIFDDGLISGEEAAICPMQGASPSRMERDVAMSATVSTGTLHGTTWCCVSQKLNPDKPMATRVVNRGWHLPQRHNMEEVAEYDNRTKSAQRLISHTGLLLVMPGNHDTDLGVLQGRVLRIDEDYLRLCSTLLGSSADTMCVFR